MRQHVNPLSRFFQLPLQLPSPGELFDHPEQPIHLDIGCARGRCILGLAELNPGWNHLGVEIRRPLVTAADRDALNSGSGNVRVLFCNANISLESWLAALPDDRLQRVSVQFPDPWFKRRHRKRRVLQPALLLAIAAALQPGRELFLQSDVLAVIEPMVALTELSGCFTRPESDARPWRQTTHSPFPRNGSNTFLRRTSRCTACCIDATHLHSLIQRHWKAVGRSSIIPLKRSSPTSERWPMPQISDPFLCCCVGGDA